MICPNCGTDNNDNLFCERCGKQLIVEVVTNTEKAGQINKVKIREKPENGKKKKTVRAPFIIALIVILLIPVSIILIGSLSNGTSKDSFGYPKEYNEENEIYQYFDSNAKQEINIFISNFAESQFPANESLNALSDENKSDFVVLHCYINAYNGVKGIGYGDATLDADTFRQVYNEFFGYEADPVNTNLAEYNDYDNKIYFSIYDANAIAKNVNFSSGSFDTLAYADEMYETQDGNEIVYFSIYNVLHDITSDDYFKTSDEVKGDYRYQKAGKGRAEVSYIDGRYVLLDYSVKWDENY